MDDELGLALIILKRRLSRNKMAVIDALIEAEAAGDDLDKQAMELHAARAWTAKEIMEVTKKLIHQEGTPG